MEDLVRPAVVAELENTDVAVRGGASQKTPAFMGSPGDDIDGCGMKGEIENLVP